jgi:glucans biosynthesis protein
MIVRRRTILKSAVVLAAGRWAAPEFVAAAAGASPPSQPFDYAWLKGQARKLGSNAYQGSQDTLPPAMAKLSYDQYQSLRFRSDHALWANTGLAFRLQFSMRSSTASREKSSTPRRCSNSTRPASIPR